MSDLTKPSAHSSAEVLGDLTRQYQDLFQRRRSILSFPGFLDCLKENPEPMIRNASAYIRDVFEYFGRRETQNLGKGPIHRFKMFDIGTERGFPIVGGESVQNEMNNILQSFVRQGFSNKLILLHGPNGSSKSSTIEAISCGMQRYSETDPGAVYRFSWVFPTEKSGDLKARGETGPIGFGTRRQEEDRSATYAFLDEDQIASKIHSEYKENPVFLIPMPQREVWLREWIGAKKGCKPEDVELPPHILLGGLSKRNQLILENLLAAYEGNISKVLRHVQVERFFYSRQYRVGIATVEPQMSIDAVEKQLTMDKNIANLPSILHNISFHEAQGELIEANRGLLEFSDLLKRPVEAFKYLLTTVEKSIVNLPASTALLDIVFTGTANEKHLDAFKTLPDFSSFRGRFELVTVPYLLRTNDEVRIYEPDVKAISKSLRVIPHAVNLLCVWAVMTRFKQPDTEAYESNDRSLIARLDPRNKARLYNGETLQPWFRSDEESTFRELRQDIIQESVGMVVYEGRFGASPREVRAILYRAAEKTKTATLSPMTIFDELDRLVKDRSVYEFLQFEPRGKYHDASHFVRMIQEEFADIFENEVQRSMNLVSEEQYQTLLQRYIDHCVASIKKERIYNSKTGGSEDPSAQLMKEVESILDVQGDVGRFREGLLGRIAAYKIDNPKSNIDVGVIFHEILKRIQDHYFNEKRKVIEDNYKVMLQLGTDEEGGIGDKERKLAASTYETLEKRFGYDQAAARECLRFTLNMNKQRRK